VLNGGANGDCGISCVPVDDEALMVTSGDYGISCVPVNNEALMVTFGISRSVGCLVLRRCL
jgi:hypothetical protein